MSRLIRMDRTGHTTLAEWTIEDAQRVRRAREAFARELQDGYFAVVSMGAGQAQQVRELPLDAPQVILRRPDRRRLMAAAASMTAESAAGGLPELASVYWRRRTTAASLRRAGRLWTLTTFAHTVPFIAAAVSLSVLKPATLPVGLVLLAHAWAIPELYAARGAGVLRRARDRDDAAESVALGLLGDLVGHRARELHSRTGLVLEQGSLGTWLVGEVGAVLVMPGGRRLHCYCVGVRGEEMPPADRISHLLLALREDEAGFATIANRAFAGAPWRLARRLGSDRREALGAAVAASRVAAGPRAG